MSIGILILDGVILTIVGIFNGTMQVRLWFYKDHNSMPPIKVKQIKTILVKRKVEVYI